MKRRRVLSLICLCILSMTMFAGCTNSEDGKNSAGEKLFGDRSEYMPNIALSDSEFSTQVTIKVTPIAQDGYALKSQAIAIKNGRVDKENEIAKIDIMLSNIQKTRSEIFDMNVSETKKVTKDALVKALDSYSTELTDYKNLLQQSEVEGTKLQFKIDSVINALDLVKQYSK